MFFILPHWRHYVGIRLFLVNSLRNASRVFLQISHKHPLGIQDELIRLVDLAKHALGHESGIHMLIKVSQHVGEYFNNNRIMGHYLGWPP